MKTGRSPEESYEHQQIADKTWGRYSTLVTYTLLTFRNTVHIVQGIRSTFEWTEGNQFNNGMEFGQICDTSLHLR